MTTDADRDKKSRPLLGGHDARTEVLTDRGWIPHPSIKISDRVACFDVESGCLFFANPTAVGSTLHNGDLLRFSSKYYEALIPSEHGLFVQPNWQSNRSISGSGKGRPFRYLPGVWTSIYAGELASNLRIPYSCGLLSHGEEREDLFGLPADAVLRVLGWWVSEGWCQRVGLPGAYVAFCQNEGPLAAEMEKTLTEAGVQHARGTSVNGRWGTTNVKWRISWRKHPALTHWLIGEAGSEGAKSKRLPDLVWSLSARQKTLVLEALIDGDGNRRKERPGNDRYCTTSNELADQVQRLAIEVGRGANKKSNQVSNPAHSPSWTVNIGKAAREKTFVVPKFNLSKEAFSGSLFWLEVSAGGYMTRRSGKPFVSQSRGFFLPPPQPGQPLPIT
jgi:hypothetical protein